MKWVGRGSGCTWPPPPHNLICPVVTPRHRSLFDTYNFTSVWRWISVEWMFMCPTKFRRTQYSDTIQMLLCKTNYHQWAFWFALILST